MAALALGVIISVVSNLIAGEVLAHRARRQTEAAAFETAIGSDRIEELGAYLSNTLGQLKIDAYLNDITTRDRVDQYVARISAFLAAPAPTPRPETPVPPVVDVPHALTPQTGDPSAIRLALQLLASAENWNALALLRRDLEQQLRRRSLPTSRHAAPRDLSAYRDLPTAARDAFQAFWRTASRAIHGDDVSLDDAIGAIGNARQAYAALAQFPPLPPLEASKYGVGDRVEHAKFGTGTVVALEGNKLTVDFDKAGEKRVIDSFVVPASAA